MIRNVDGLALAAIACLLTLSVISSYPLCAVGLVLLLIPYDLFGLWISEAVEVWREGKARQKLQKEFDYEPQDK